MTLMLRSHQYREPRTVSGYSTSASIFSPCTPCERKRLRCTMRMSGRVHISMRFVAGWNPLHAGQNHASLSTRSCRIAYCQRRKSASGGGLRTSRCANDSKQDCRVRVEDASACFSVLADSCTTTLFISTRSHVRGSHCTTKRDSTRDTVVGDEYMNN